jgi:hypothetical protein
MIGKDILIFITGLSPSMRLLKYNVNTPMQGIERIQNKLIYRVYDMSGGLKNFGCRLTSSVIGIY